MPITEPGKTIVATFMRQITQLVEKFENSESEKADMLARHAAEKESLVSEWEKQVDELKHERDTARAELIDRNARLDLIEGELTIMRADHGMLQREYNAQTASLESLRRSAAAFGGAVQDVLGKNLEAEQAERNLHGADEIERLLAVEHRKPALVAHEARP